LKGNLASVEDLPSLLFLALNCPHLTDVLAVGPEFPYPELFAALQADDIVDVLLLAIGRGWGGWMWSLVKSHAQLPHILAAARAAIAKGLRDVLEGIFLAGRSVLEIAEVAEVLSLLQELLDNGQGSVVVQIFRLNHIWLDRLQVSEMLAVIQGLAAAPPPPDCRSRVLLPLQARHFSKEDVLGLIRTAVASDYPELVSALNHLPVAEEFQAGEVLIITRDAIRGGRPPAVLYSLYALPGFKQLGVDQIVELLQEVQGKGGASSLVDCWMDTVCLDGKKLQELVREALRQKHMRLLCWITTLRMGPWPEGLLLSLLQGVIAQGNELAACICLKHEAADQLSAVEVQGLIEMAGQKGMTVLKGGLRYLLQLRGPMAGDETGVLSWV
jgi:hypothetical protein